MKDSTVRRRYSDFEWLRNELERDSKVIKRRSLIGPINNFLCFRLSFRHYLQRPGNVKCPSVKTREFLRSNLSRIVAKDSKLSLTKSPDIPWHRMRDAYTCSCKSRRSTRTTRREKFATLKEIHRGKLKVFEARSKTSFFSDYQSVRERIIIR